MPLGARDLAIGRCYLKRDREVVSIEGLSPKQVTYRPRQGGPGRRVWSFSLEAPVPRFLAEVEREVPCDYEPGGY